MIIDSHTHMPSPEWGKHNCSFKSVETAVAHMQKKGIDRAIFNTWQGVFAETEDDINTANRVALELHKKYQDFLYPGAVIHPAFPEVSKKWLDHFREQGLMWVGELVQYKCEIEFDEPSWLKLFEYCASNGHAVQLHNSERTVNVAVRFPDMQIISSHIDINTLESLSQKSNIWLDMSGRCAGFKAGILEKALSFFGADRLLFGTDFTGYEPNVFINRVNSAIKGINDRKKLYYQNIIKLLAKIGSLPIAPSEIKREHD